MNQPAHPITLEQVFFTRSVVIAIPEHAPDLSVSLPVPQNHIDVVPVEGQVGRYMATMGTKLNQEANPAAPYIVDIECFGIFVVDDTLTPEEAARGVTITAHSVLYGAIRESAAWITSRQPYGQLLLGLSVLQPSAPKTEGDSP